MNGTYACSCIEGFALTDQFSGVCRANEASETKLLFSTGEEIHGELLAKQMKLFEVIKNESRIESVDFDPKDMMVYWADSEERAIKRSFIPGSKEHPDAQIGHPQEIQASTNKVTAVAYDFMTGNVYWAEVDRWTGVSSAPRGVIAVSKNDGRYKREIAAGQLDNPTSIALDPEHGLMFWTDAGDKPKIESAWMDGTKRKTIVATGIGHPEGITIDFAMGHTLYWVDSKLNTLETMDHEGHKRHVLLRGGVLRRPISVDVFENHIYWVNRDTGAVMQHDKFGRGVPVTVARNLVNPRSVKVLHPLKYNTTAKDPCTQDNFHCSHLCLLIPGGRARCACPNGQNFVDRQQTVCDAGNCF
jgi:low density lipoprotein-related protein 2